MDTVNEVMASYTYVSRPPRYVTHLADLFNAWAEWASHAERKHMSTPRGKNAELKPMGEKIKPDWLQYEFSNLEEFYQYLDDVLKLSTTESKDDNNGEDDAT